MRNIRHSHTIDGTSFNRADLVVSTGDGRDNVIVVKFKEFSASPKEEQEVELTGNIRSFSTKVEDKNKVDIYVFSYLDRVDEEYDTSNKAILDGKICKKDTLRQTSKGKHYIHFTVANNIITNDGQKINSYIPCTAWGKMAKEISEDYCVGDGVSIDGQLRSRHYKKKHPNNEVEIKIAHELNVDKIQKL